MAVYKFKVSDAAGQIGETLVEADSCAEATRRLQRRGMVPLESLGEGSLATGAPRGAFGRRGKFDVIDFTDRLVPLLQAHIPLERALGIVGEGLENPFAASVVADLRKGLHEGRKFSQLIRDRSHFFPTMYASMVEAGEEAGALPQVMADLRQFLLDGRELRGFVVSASIYPCFVVLVSVCLLGFLLGIIVPKFAQMLTSAGRVPSFSTRLLLGASELVRGYWWLLPVFLAAAAFLLIRARNEGRVREWLDGVVLKLPVVRDIVLHANIARLARTMAILMRSGVHLLDTVAISARVLGNSHIRHSISGLASQLRQGQRLSAALGGNKIVPPFMLRMLAVGEETGAVEGMLERVAERYEGELRRNIRRLLSIFEPAVIVVLGGLVGGIAVTLFLAINDLRSGF